MAFSFEKKVHNGIKHQTDSRRGEGQVHGQGSA